MLREAGYSKENPLSLTLEVPLEPRDYMPSGGVKLGEGLKEVYERTGLVKVTLFTNLRSLLNDLMEAKPQKHLYWVGAATMDRRTTC